MNTTKGETKRGGKTGKYFPKKTAASPAGFICFPFSTIILSALIGNGGDFQGRPAKRRVEKGVP